jgi:hypothetical protein
LTSTSQNSDIFQGDEVSLNVSSDCDFAFYQWQVSSDGGKSWQDVKNANSATFKVDDLAASTNEYLYRCKVSQPQRDTAYSAVSTITVWKNTPFGRWAFDNNLRGQNGAENSKRFFDNITNLERFVFGFPVDKPTSYSANSMFKQVATTQAAGLVFPVRKSATDVNVIAKYSADLQNWQVAQTQKIGEQGDFYLYCAEVDFTEKGKVFFKIEISQ